MIKYILYLLPPVLSNLYLMKFNVVFSNTNEPFLQIVDQNVQRQTGKISSYYEIEDKKIICFGRRGNGILIFIYSYDFQSVISLSILGSRSSFLKSLHVKGNIGAFIYILDGYPEISLAEYKNGEFKVINKINLYLELNKNDEEFSESTSYNDFIKVSDNKLSYIGYMDKI